MTSSTLRLRVNVPALLALCGSVALTGCGAHSAQVPARLQLQPYGRVAVATTTSLRSSSGR